MGKTYITRTYKINGMTCVNCEHRIERSLKNQSGIANAVVSYTKGTAAVTFDPEVIRESEIKELIRKLGYQPAGSAVSEAPVSSIKLAGVFVVLLALYVIFSRFGGLQIFNSFPEAKEGMGYGMLFVIGLLTSTHCIAMCGGINLSQCVPNAAGSPKGSDAPDAGLVSKISSLVPSIQYNAGRVISYTVIGGIVGALGQIVTFTGAAKGMIAVIAGLFMVIMGLNMLNLFPWLRRLNPRMPKVFAVKIDERKKGGRPLYVGLLNGLMPCGPLQAMQLYALSTGDPVKGALSMLLFSLGTVPLMFGLGALSTVLTKRFTRRMMTVSAALVILLGVFMLSNGMSLSGFAVPSFASGFGKADAASQSVKAELGDGVQTVTTQLTSGGYEPIAVQAGIPVQWNLHAEQEDLNGCNYRIIIPEYNIEKQLEPGDNLITFTPEKSGFVSFSCWMGMIRSQIAVVDDLADSTQIPVSQTLPSYQSSCCQ